MPSSEQIAKAAARREARRNAKQEHSDRSDAELQAISKTSEEQTLAREPALGRVVTPPAKPRMSRAEAKAAKRRVAEEQAERDVRVATVPVDAEIVLTPGVKPPLHVLNRLAAQGAKALKEDANAIAQAAGKAAFNEAIGRRTHAPADFTSRHARMRDQQAAIDAAAKK